MLAQLTPLSTAAPVDANMHAPLTQLTPLSTAAPVDDKMYVPLTMESLQDSQPATIAFGLVLSYIAAGTLFYWQATGWDLLQSLYFVIVTLTSVGYGDLAPVGEGVRLFTAMYILFGVGILGTALGEVVSSLLNVDVTPAGRVIKWLSGIREVARDNKAGTHTTDACGEVEKLLEAQDATSALTTILRTVGACLLVGTGAFAALEPGLSLSDALYYAVVTATTVGYGDFSPQTPLEEAFVCGYALFGTILLARSLGAVAAFPLERRREYQQKLVLEQYGGELDMHELGDLQATLVELELCDFGERGSCTRSDFALAMLVRQDKVTKADVDAALRTFEKLDIDGSGELDEEDVKAWAKAKPREDGLSDERREVMGVSVPP